MLLVYKLDFFYRGCSGQHHPMSAVTAFPLQFCTALENVLYTVIVRRVYEYSLLQLIKIYGFFEDEENLKCFVISSCLLAGQFQDCWMFFLSSSLLV